MKGVKGVKGMKGVNLDSRDQTLIPSEITLKKSIVKFYFLFYEFF